MREVTGKDNIIMVGNHNHVTLISLYILLKKGFIAEVTPFRCPQGKNGLDFSQRANIS